MVIKLSPFLGLWCQIAQLKGAAPPPFLVKIKIPDLEECRFVPNINKKVFSTLIYSTKKNCGNKVQDIRMKMLALKCTIF